MRLRLVLAMAATLAFATLSATDLTITFNTTGKGGGGTEIQYYSSNFHKSRNDSQQRDTLVDFQQGISYVIDHKKKQISRISFDDAMAALDSMNSKLPEGMGAMMGAMFGDPNDCQVEKKGTETVAGRTCTIWSVRVAKMSELLSVDPALKMPVPDASYARMMQARAAQFAKAGPMGAVYKRFYEEMAKIKGIPLKTHVTMMGVDVATEATRIETGPIPQATFTLPDGYKMEDMGKKMREQMKGK